MGTGWIRSGRPQPIDLGLFVGEHFTALDKVQVLSEGGGRYTLTPTEDTVVEGGQIHAVRFQSQSVDRVLLDDIDSMVLAPFIAASSLRNWIAERRHFPKDDIVSMPLLPLQKGSPLRLGDHETSPLVRGYVFERGDRGPFQRGLPNF